MNNPTTKSKEKLPSGPRDLIPRPDLRPAGPPDLPSPTGFLTLFSHKINEKDDSGGSQWPEMSRGKGTAPRSLLSISLLGSALPPEIP